MIFRYALVNEEKPNSFDPIYWTNDIRLYSLKSIDNMTKNYSQEELIDYLKDNKLIDDKNINLQIIYDNNGIRKLKEGVMYKEEHQVDILSYIKNNILLYIGDSSFMNDFYQRMESDKSMDILTKNIIKVLFDNRHLKKEELKVIVDELISCDYADIRKLYFYIKNNNDVVSKSLKKEL